MNKYLVWLPAFIILGLTMYKQLNEAIESKPVSRNILFSVHKSSSYASVVYNNTSARVNIIVEKVNTNGQHTIVWHKNFEQKYLCQYPSLENALKENITICNLSQRKEYLVVHRILTYNSKGSKLEMEDRILIEDNNCTIEICV
jgi:hypothetical protein